MASAPSPHGLTRRLLLSLVAGAIGTTFVACGSSVGSGTPSTLAPLVDDAGGATTPTGVSLAPITVEPVPLSGLVLDVGGIGTVSFGDDAQEVIAYVGTLLGASTEDTEWVNVRQAGLACAAEWHRAVSWGVLRLEFTAGSELSLEENSDAEEDLEEGDSPDVEDGSAESGPVGPGLWRGWEYGLDGRLGEEPQNLITPSGLALGARVDELRAVAAEVELLEGEEGVFPPSFRTASGLTGYLTGTTDADVITVLQAGVRCG